MNNKRGSATVEAAMIFPLLILLVASMISIAIWMYEDIRVDTQLHRSLAQSDLTIAGADIYLLMRGIWIMQ